MSSGPRDLAALLDLAAQGDAAFVGVGPRYEWGSLYGGQIVAQALRAAAMAVESPMMAHSMRAYFIRRGDHNQSVRYEVDRIRDGRSFCTRRVVALQAAGAILNLEASFHVAEDGPDLTAVRFPHVPGPLEGKSERWTPFFERSELPVVRDDAGLRHRRVWMRADGSVGDDELLNRCALAYISDDVPMEAGYVMHPVTREREPEHGTFYSASLDHTIWFHRPVRVDRWQLHDLVCTSMTNNRALMHGNIFDEDGTLVATVAQEALIREARPTNGREAAT